MALMTCSIPSSERNNWQLGNVRRRRITPRPSCHLNWVPRCRGHAEVSLGVGKCRRRLNLLADIRCLFRNYVLKRLCYCIFFYRRDSSIVSNVADNAPDANSCLFRRCSKVYTGFPWRNADLASSNEALPSGADKTNTVAANPTTR